MVRVSANVRYRDRAKAANRVESEHSLLFPMLFEQLDADRRLNVLDVGPAVPETIEFFSRFKCRLTIGDLFADERLRDPKIAGSAFEHQLRNLLGRDSQVDICLFWDYLNYLDIRAMRGFGNALFPYLHRDSRAHAFGALNTTTPVAGHRYGVTDLDRFVVRKLPDGQEGRHPHPQADFRESLTCFEIKRGTLLREGRLEMLLAAA